jgi:hypothetical protein
MEPVFMRVGGGSSKSAQQVGVNEQVCCVRVLCACAVCVCCVRVLCVRVCGRNSSECDVVRGWVVNEQVCNRHTCRVNVVCVGCNA